MRRAEVASGGAAALVGLAAYGLTLPFPEMPDGHPGPALFPRLLSGLLVLFGGLLAVRGLRAPVPAPLPGAAPAAAPDRAGLVNALLVIGGVVAYVGLVERLGFVLTVALLDVVLMRRLGVRLPVAAVVSALVAVGIYFLFARVLLVPLPRGLLSF